jgi:hypothetical protein
MRAFFLYRGFACKRRQEDPHQQRERLCAKAGMTSHVVSTATLARPPQKKGVDPKIDPDFAVIERSTELITCPWRT